MDSLSPTSSSLSSLPIRDFIHQLNQRHALGLSGAEVERSAQVLQEQWFNVAEELRGVDMDAFGFLPLPKQLPTCIFAFFTPNYDPMQLFPPASQQGQSVGSPSPSVPSRVSNATPPQPHQPEYSLDPTNTMSPVSIRSASSTSSSSAAHAPSDSNGTKSLQAAQSHSLSGGSSSSSSSAAAASLPATSSGYNLDLVALEGNILDSHGELSREDSSASGEGGRDSSSDTESGSDESSSGDESALPSDGAASPRKKRTKKWDRHSSLLALKKAVDHVCASATREELVLSSLANILRAAMQKSGKHTQNTLRELMKKLQDKQNAHAPSEEDNIARSMQQMSVDGSTSAAPRDDASSTATNHSSASSSSSSSFQCGLCRQSHFVSSASPVVLECGHQFDGSCISGYINDLVGQKQAVGIKCPHTDASGASSSCAHELSTATIQCLLSATDFDAYLNATLMSFIESDDCLTVTCPNEKCGSIMSVESLNNPHVPETITEQDDDGRVLTKETYLHFIEYRVRCRDCSTNFCAKCRVQPYHKGHTCAGFKEYQASRHCRFCSSKLSAEESLRLVNGVRDVCGEKECQDKSLFCCEKTLECGCACNGVKNEAECLPCIKHKLDIDEDEYCGICYVEGLKDAPCLQLQGGTCRHVFHFSCLKTKLESRWPGARISFDFARCPLCQQEIDHPMLANLLQPIKALEASIREKSLQRLQYEGREKDPAVVNENGAHFGDPIGFAMKQYLFYICFKCTKPYFAGGYQCQEASQAFDPAELICPACQPSSVEDCATHGREWLAHKCRYCLTPDHQALVFGRGWTPLANVVKGDLVWSMQDKLGGDTAVWARVTDDIIRLQLAADEPLYELQGERVNLLTNGTHMHMARSDDGVWSTLRSDAEWPSVSYLPVGACGSGIAHQWPTATMTFLPADINTDQKKNLSWCRFIGAFLAGGSVESADGKMVHLQPDGANPASAKHMEEMLSCLGWLGVGQDGLITPAGDVCTIQPRFEWSAVDTASSLGRYSCLSAPLYDYLWPMVDHARSLAADTTMPVRLAVMDARAGDVLRSGEQFLFTECEGTDEQDPCQIYHPDAGRAVSSQWRLADWQSAEAALDEQRVPLEERPLPLRFSPSFQHPRFVALLSWRAQRLLRIQQDQPDLVAPHTARLTELPPATSLVTGTIRHGHSVPRPDDSTADADREAAKLMLEEDDTSVVPEGATDGDHLSHEDTMVLDPLAASPRASAESDSCAAEGRPTQAECPDLNMTADELTRLKAILSSHVDVTTGDDIPPWWSAAFGRRIFYSWRFLLSHQQARAVLAGWIDTAASGQQAHKDGQQAQIDTASVFLRDDLALLGALAGWQASFEPCDQDSTSPSWRLSFHAPLEDDNRLKQVRAPSQPRVIPSTSRTDQEVLCLEVETSNFLVRRVHTDCACIGPCVHRASHPVFTHNCCSYATWTCWGSTHFCDKCHKSGVWQTLAVFRTNKNKKKIWEYEQCTSLQKPVEDIGRDTTLTEDEKNAKLAKLLCAPRSCPLGVRHPPNGIEFGLGCSMCEDRQSIGDAAARVESVRAKLGSVKADLSKSPRRFTPTADFDMEGVFWYLGTCGRTQPWSNPAEAGFVKIGCSGAMNDSAPLSSLVGRDLVRLVSQPLRGSWFTWELIDLQLCLTHYTLKHYNSWDTECLRAWSIEGSNDGGAHWEAIATYTNDTSLNKKGATHTWQVDSRGRKYSMFRILQTGRNSNNNFYLALSGSEFYGELSLAPVAPPVVAPTPDKRVFTPKSDFDTNGLIYWLGTQQGKSPWRNPAELGLVIVACSELAAGPPPSEPTSAVVGREVVRCVSAPKPNQWFVIDLTPSGKRIKPTHYSLRHYSSWDLEALRNWRFEGSANGVDWYILSVHLNDSSLDRKGGTHTWALPGCQVVCTMFRIWQTGLNSNNHHFLACSGFEVYGTIEESGALPQMNRPPMPVPLQGQPPLMPPHPQAQQPLWSPAPSADAGYPAQQARPPAAGALSVQPQSYAAPSVSPTPPLPASAPGNADSGLVLLQYTRDFDQNGLMYFLGSQGRRAPWRNPADAGLVAAFCSELATMPPSLPASAICGQETVRCCSVNKPGMHFLVDLKERQMAPTHYTLRHYASFDTEALRNWKFEGSNDGARWDLLQSHRDDRALASKGATATWPIPGAHDRFYRLFKLTMTGPNSNHSNYLALAGLELYGTLQLWPNTGTMEAKVAQSAAHAAGLRGDTVDTVRQYQQRFLQQQQHPQIQPRAVSYLQSPAPSVVSPPPSNPLLAALSPASSSASSASSVSASAADAGSSGLRFGPPPYRPFEDGMEFVYQSDLDANGIFYWLGTQRWTKPWQNPAEAGIVTVTSVPLALQPKSEPASAIVGRSLCRCVTLPNRESWFVIDLVNVWIRPTAYTLRHYDSFDTEALRDWKLQGSNDGKKWTKLLSHKKDESLDRRGATKTWPIPKPKKSYRMIRILQTGRNSNNHYFMALSSIEIYGKVYSYKKS